MHEVEYLSSSNIKHPPPLTDDWSFATSQPDFSGEYEPFDIRNHEYFESNNNVS